MKNNALSLDYIKRATVRLKALEVYYQEASWADVIREAQEAVELGLKGMLKFYNIEAPRIHDVSGILLENKSVFPEKLQLEIENLGNISRSLRRDRELAFYGSEDLTPLEFYKKEDASLAKKQAKVVIDTIREFCK